MNDAAIAHGDRELRTQPGIWRGKLRKPTTVEEALEQWSPVTLAWAVERGLVDTTPLGFTRAGWRWIKARRRGLDEARLPAGEVEVLP